MSSSDEEGEFCPEIHVSEYAFVDRNGAPISFAVLPLQWSENEVIGDDKTQVFLDGLVDDGLLKIHKQVVAWKFELSYALPELVVLSKNKNWMTLQKPRKSFGSRIRTILTTIHWMHFMKKNTEASAKSVWNHLQNVFSLYEFQPSERDLLCHKLLIDEAVKRDKDLAAKYEAYGDIHAGAPSERIEKSCSRQGISPLKKPTCVTSRKFLNQGASPDFERSLSREKNMLTQTKDVDSSFNTEEFMKSQQQISAANAWSFRSVADKTITLGRVEASVKAVRTALEKLEAGASLEEAKAVCGPEVINQLFKWKDILAVYLGPFLHRMRYTSFGRHFTKPEKLKEIVDRLHRYAQDGDTIVDFCCGSNDFSRLLKEKLEEVGKSCLFRNYDLFPPKDDFNFERRDWMSVNLDELPTGSRLIMGLNPPFGFKASLANKFINKALTFRPKLIILIVPAETKRLDAKEAYDLIWEDDRVVSGKSFYLPGSVDADNKQLEQWNIKAPPLYLWSCSDSMAEHKAIARQQGHVYDGPEELHGNEENAKEFNYLMQEKHDCFADFSREVYACGGISSILDGVPEVNDGFESEGSRGKHMEGQFSTWKNNDLTKQIHDNVTHMQHEGHGHIDALPKAALGYGMALETDDDLCIDMELSSPDNRLDPPGHYEVRGTEGRDGVLQNRGKGTFNLGFKTEYKFRDNQTS